MKYKNYVRTITEKLEKYKAEVDELEKSYVSAQQEVRKKADNMRGQWTEEYIAKYLESNPKDKDFKEKFQQVREGVEQVVLSSIEALKMGLDDYFDAPVDADLANKIASIKLSGLQLSDREFKIFSEKAKNYMEFRLLQQLAVSRTKSSSKVEISEDGTVNAEQVEVSNPYLKINIPNIDYTYQAFEEYERSAKGLLYSYSGKNAGLVHLLDKNVPDYISIAMDGYFRNNAAEKFTKVMEKINSILPENNRKLTEHDRKFIDTLINEKYPTLVKDRVRELAKADIHIANLLSLDGRYAEYLEESEA